MKKFKKVAYKKKVRSIYKFLVNLTACVKSIFRRAALNSLGEGLFTTYDTLILLASYCNLFHSSTSRDSRLKGCGTLQPLRSVAEYVVPNAMCL